MDDAPGERKQALMSRENGIHEELLEQPDHQTASAAESAVRSDLVTRRRWVATVAVGAVLFASGGVAASQVIKSPAQVAADSKPPEPDVLTAPVEQRVLKETIVLRGTVVAEQSVQVTPTVSGGEGASAPVVTKVPVQAGDTVKAGDVLLEVSGRPVFALKGSLPVYRDLKPGVEGEDVAQLQAALDAMGHGSGDDASGSFGAGTKAALESFYASIGYEPLPAVDDDGEAVKAAEGAVKVAKRALEDARTAAEGAEPGAETAASQDEAAADKASEDGSSPASATAAGGGGDGSGEQAQTALERAEEDLTDAQQALDEARAAAGPMVSAGELVFLSGFPARVDAVQVRPGSRVSGEALTVSAGRLEVRGYLQEHQKGLIRQGQRVEILSELSGITARAEVASVAESLEPGQTQGEAGEDGQGGTPAAPQGYLVVVEPDKRLDPQLAGQEVRLTIDAAATDGEALVVPITAISSGADGRTTVTVVGGGGVQHQVEVRVGTQGDGFVEVTPIGGGELSQGDRVVTGISGDAGAVVDEGSHA